MKKIFVESFNPSFNRLDFIKFIYENTTNGLVDSKKILDKIIDNDKVQFEIEDKKAIEFVDKLNRLGVFCRISDVT